MRSPRPRRARAPVSSAGMSRQRTASHWPAPTCPWKCRVACGASWPTSQGWFEFTNLAPGDYHVSATEAGYLTRFYGQTLDRDRPARIRLKQGQVRSDVDLILPKSGVVTVQVTDEPNAPVEGAQVRVSQVILGQRAAAVRAWSSKQSTPTTNDRGEIRVADLAPGDYYVSAMFVSASSNGNRVSDATDVLSRCLQLHGRAASHARAQSRT